MGRSEATVYMYLKEWSKAGYMSEEKTKEKGSPVSFKLLYPLSEIEKKAVVTFGISGNPTNNRSKFEEEFKATLNAFPSLRIHGGDLKLKKCPYRQFRKTKIKITKI